MTNPPITTDTQTLRTLIKEVVREVINEERFKVWQLVIPEVSDAEQAEIEQSLGLPSDYHLEEFVDMTDWLNDAS